jgi:hypothetical protein
MRHAAATAQPPGEEGGGRLAKESRGTPSGTPRTPRRSSQSGRGSFLFPPNVEHRILEIVESRALSNAKKIADRSASPKLKPKND